MPAEPRSAEERQELLRAYHCLAIAALGLGHFGPAESFLAEIVELDHGVDGTAWERRCESARVALDWRRGRWQGLESRLEESSARTSDAEGCVAHDLILGSLWLSQGHLDQAESRFESVLEYADERGVTPARVAAAAGLGRIRLARGDADAAREAAGPGVEMVERKGVWIWGKEIVPVAVQALLALDQPADAAALAERFAAGVQGRDAPDALAASLWCRAAAAAGAGRPGAAAQLFAAAGRLWDELPCPYEAAQAREARGRCLLAEDKDGGEESLLSALDTFEGLSARWDSTRVRAELRAHGVSAPSAVRVGRRAYGDELSPREEEVAALVRSGHKNREIAETLFISPRTVEAHVASAIRKLGLGSRQELAAAFDVDPEKRDRRDPRLAAAH